MHTKMVLGNTPQNKAKTSILDTYLIHKIKRSNYIAALCNTHDDLIAGRCRLNYNLIVAEEMRPCCLPDLVWTNQVSSFVHPRTIPQPCSYDTLSRDNYQNQLITSWKTTVLLLLLFVLHCVPYLLNKLDSSPQANQP